MKESKKEQKQTTGFDVVTMWVVNVMQQMCNGQHNDTQFSVLTGTHLELLVHCEACLGSAFVLLALLLHGCCRFAVSFRALLVLLQKSFLFTLKKRRFFLQRQKGDKHLCTSLKLLFFCSWVAALKHRNRYKNISFGTCISVKSSTGFPTTPMEHYNSNNFLIRHSTSLSTSDLRSHKPHTEITFAATCPYSTATWLQSSCNISLSHATEE